MKSCIVKRKLYSIFLFCLNFQKKKRQNFINFVVVISKYIHGIIAKLPEGGTVFIHHSMYSPDLAENIENGTSLRIKKVGYDEEHKKYIWEVL